MPPFSFFGHEPAGVREGLHMAVFIETIKRAFYLAVPYK